MPKQKYFSLYTLFIGIFLVALAGLSTAVFLSVTHQQKALTKESIEGKIALARTAERMLSDPLWLHRASLVTGLEKILVDGLASYPDVIYFRIVNIDDGSVYASNFKEDYGKTFLGDPALQEESLIIRDNTFQERAIKEIVFPSRDKKIFLGFTLESVQLLIKETIQRNALLGISTILLIFLLFFLMLFGIIRPIKRLIWLVGEVSRGNLEAKSNIKSRIEIGQLAVALDKMTDDLKESRLALEEAKTVLEVKVEARTKELRELAEGLEEEVKRRTKEIQEKMVELERFQKLAVGRELKMVELKKEIESLKKELEKPKGRKNF